MPHIVKGHLNGKQLKLVKLENANSLKIYSKISYVAKKQVKLTKLELNL